MLIFVFDGVGEVLTDGDAGIIGYGGMGEDYTYHPAHTRRCVKGVLYHPLWALRALSAGGIYCIVAFILLDHRTFA